MEELGSSRFESIGNTVKRRRSHTLRRPRSESQQVLDGHDVSSLSSTPPSDDMRAGSSDENNGGDYSFRRKELSLSQCDSRFLPARGPDGEKLVKRNKKVDIGLDELYGNSGLKDSSGQRRTVTNHGRSSEGVLAPANWKSTSRMKESSEPQKTMALNNSKSGESSGPSFDELGIENKVKKVKLKVGGATRTIDTSSSLKASRGSDAAIQRQKLTHKDKSDDDSSLPTDKRSGLQGIPWKDFSRRGFNLGREESSMGKGNGNNHSGKQGDKTDPMRKSKRATKKRVVDGFDDDDDDDEEIRYLEKLKNAKLSSGNDEESSRKHRRLSKFSGNVSQNIEGISRAGKDAKKKSSSDDTDYEEETEETFSDAEPEGRMKKKLRKDLVDVAVEQPEMTLMTRRRALQSGKGISSPGGSGVEFSNGLPPAPPRKQKEKLSEVEQQLKKAEAAQRRRMQNEKAARESEAEAIRKILGQDSNRKKQEEKRKKRMEELAQEKEADELMRASTSIRFIMGPNGTTVTFPNAIGLPSIFDSKTCSYPPPREICAGPSCRNPYKYRDSKTKLPLCSLQCYKAVQGNTHLEAATC